MNFNERIAELADLEAKATPGEWEGYDLSFCDQFIEQRISLDKGEMPVLSLNRENSENNQQFICALRNKALPLLREQAEWLKELFTFEVLACFNMPKNAESIKKQIEEKLK